jgi:hypothetical protein
MNKPKRKYHKRKPIEHPPRFIVLNRYAQVWCGLRGGKPVFSDDWSEAKTLESDEQFFNLRIAADHEERNFEKHYL